MVSLHKKVNLNKKAIHSKYTVDLRKHSVIDLRKK